MVEQSIQSTLLTEEEAAVYDRQIRLWGVEAQQRLRKAKVLLIGISSLGNEVCKNIILAGIQHLTILDDTILSEEDWKNQFLAPQEMIGKSKAQSSLACAKDLNPMVKIVADTENIENKSEDFIKEFDIVCATGCTGDVQIRVNEICHRLGIKYLSGNVFGYYGYMFSDFGVHTFMQEKVKPMAHKDNSSPSSAKKAKIVQDAETEFEEKVSSFCTLSDALSVPVFEGKSLRQVKQYPKTYLVMKVMLEYQRRYGCFPNQAKSNQELENLLDVRNDVFEKLRVDNDILTDDFTGFCVGTLVPVSAVVGGVISQEIIKAVSGKDCPHQNFFFYDGVLTSGTVEHISPKKEENEELHKCKADEKPITVVLEDTHINSALLAV